MFMDNRRIPINVSVNPSEYSGRNYRVGGAGFGGSSDIREKMNQRMREFEEDSRKWRDQFMSSTLPAPPSLIDSTRPRMFVNFPEFPELSSGSRLAAGNSFFTPPPPMSLSSSSSAQSSHKSYIEEDDHGLKRYKIIFDIGDFKPNEIQVRTEGRQLIVKGDREIVAGSSTESKQFNREITLPDFVEPTSVTSYLSDGVLTVEAPVQLDRLGGGGIGGGITSSSSSTQQSSSSSSNLPLRHSPFRDNNRIGGGGISNFRGSREDLLNHQYSEQQPAASSATAGGGLSSSTQPQVAQYKFNMSEFRPEDIAITVTDTSLKIHAVREENDLRDNGKTYREFKREIGLPQGADVKRLKNSLQPDGTLLIDIPVTDNLSMRPPPSSSANTTNSHNLANKFNNFSLNDNAAASSSIASTATAAAASAASSSHQYQKQQQQQQQQQQYSLNNSAVSSGSLINNSTNNGLIDTSNNGKELKLTFDLAGYKPEDLSIKVIDNNTLKVHAVHIDNSRGNQIHREYTRQYILPEWVQPELLRARMSDNGVLTVEVPLPQIQPNKYERSINITK